MTKFYLLAWFLYGNILHIYITQNSRCAQKYVFKIIWQIRHFLSLSSNYSTACFSLPYSLCRKKSDTARGSSIYSSFCTGFLPRTSHCRLSFSAAIAEFGGLPQTATICLSEEVNTYSSEWSQCRLWLKIIVLGLALITDLGHKPSLSLIIYEVDVQLSWA